MSSNVLLLNKDKIEAVDNTAEVVSASVLSTPNTLMHRGEAAEVYANAFFYSSDSRLKSNIQDLTSSSIDDLNPVAFTWTDSGNLDVGFIAQEVKEVIPEAVVEGSNDFLSISLTPIVAHLVKEVQELKQKIKELEENG